MADDQSRQDAAETEVLAKTDAAPAARDPSRLVSAAPALLILIGFTLSATFALLSGDGTGQGILQFDDLTHYLYAKWAWQWPIYLLDHWGRPGFTALYFLPARLGWPACRLLSAVLTAAAVWLAVCIGRRIGLRHAWAVVPFAYAQPLFFQLSQTTLTETPTAFYLTLAVYLALIGRWSWSAAALALCFVTRQETIVLLPVWLLCARRRRVGFLRLWPLGWSLLLVNLSVWAVGMEPNVSRLFNLVPTTQYGAGGWLSFFARSVHAFGPGIAVLALIGLPATYRSAGGSLVVIPILVYFSAHTLIRALGLFGSGGYARFLVPISPLIAVAALAGWQQLRQQGMARRRRVLVAAGFGMVFLWISTEREIDLIGRGMAAGTGFSELAPATTALRIMTAVFTLLILVALAGARPGGGAAWTRASAPAGVAALVLTTSYVLCRPLPAPPEARLIDAALDHLAGQGLADRELISANIWLDFVTGRDLPPDRPSVRAQLERAPLGTLFAWERQFAGGRERGIALDELRTSTAFRCVHASGALAFQEEPYLRVFEKVGAWGRTPERGTTE